MVGCLLGAWCSWCGQACGAYQSRMGPWLGMPDFLADQAFFASNWCTLTHTKKISGCRGPGTSFETRQEFVSLLNRKGVGG